MFTSGRFIVLHFIFLSVINLKLNVVYITLAGVAQLIECWTANQRVTGSIPSQGTGLGCGRGPQ